MHRPRQLRRTPVILVQALLLAALISVCVSPLIAQTPLPDSSIVKRVFGLADDEFFKGAWMTIRPDTAGAPDATVWEKAEQNWQLAESLGINILRVQVEDLNTHMTAELLKQRTERDFCYRA